MNLEELKINNLLEYNGQVCRVMSLLHPTPMKDPRYSDKPLVEIYVGSGVITVPLEDCEAIELTDKWFYNFGFYRIGKNRDFVKNGVFIHRRKRGWVMRRSVPILKNVHTLQNLYFALKHKQVEI